MGSKMNKERNYYPILPELEGLAKEISEELPDRVTCEGCGYMSISEDFDIGLHYHCDLKNIWLDEDDLDTGCDDGILNEEIL